MFAWSERDFIVVLCVFSLVVGVAGWAVIEGLIWLFSHISIEWL